MAKSKEKKKSSVASKKWEMIKVGRKACPKCGKGVYLGEHKNPQRLVCGKCSYVEFTNK
ncbi:MAG: 30S ribosomal protein S27ae [Nanoarchaeota archaeon]|nr:30S ribosomal protein S27ae [Nanoarchaeota archaeon]